MTENDPLGRVEIAAVRVGVRAKEGGRGGGRESKYGFLFSLPGPLPLPSLSLPNSLTLGI